MSEYSARPKHVVIVNGVYDPEPLVSAQMGRDLAESLAQRPDVTVTVLCPFPSRPLGTDYPGLHPRLEPLVRIEGGVTVVRLPSFRDAHSRLASRMRESLSFGVAVRSFLRRQSQPIDLVYANTWPMLSQAVIARHCTFRGIPLVWHIQDVYPESMLRRLPKPVAKIIRRPLVTLDRWILSQACHTVVLSDGVRDTYIATRQLPTTSMTVVSNWIDDKRYSPLPDRQIACSRYGIDPAPFTFCYVGNIGAAAGVDFLIRAFHRTTPAPFQLVIAGDGAMKAKCQAIARDLDDQRVVFISDSNVENTPWLLALANVCLLPLARGAGGSSVPSKLMAYLLAGKPVLAAVDAGCDTARAIQDAQCGWIGPPEDEAWLAGALLKASQLPRSQLEDIGSRGRVFGVRHYGQAAGVTRLATLLIDVATSRNLH